MEEMMRKVFFIDFDGTITRRDTCAAMVEEFARDGWQELNDQWERRELSTQECANLIFALFDATIHDIARFIYEIEIDPYFSKFLELCRSHDYKVYILSDGYDFNIETILGKYNLQVPYYANKLVYGSAFAIECPYINEDCGKCGTCKTRLMESLKGECQSIYIGDGYSDTCPAQHADLVYAKDTLYRFCLEKGIKAIPYRNFNDIVKSMKMG
jgi:2-hydroxy-3-keto-5-methylthiopentenyl-1-phosphate phosphatase